MKLKAGEPVAYMADDGKRKYYLSNTKNNRNIIGKETKFEPLYTASQLQEYAEAMNAELIEKDKQAQIMIERMGEMLVGAGDRSHLLGNN